MKLKIENEKVVFAMKNGDGSHPVLSTFNPALSDDVRARYQILLVNVMDLYKRSIDVCNATDLKRLGSAIRELHELSDQIGYEILESDRGEK